MYLEQGTGTSETSTETDLEQDESTKDNEGSDVVTVAKLRLQIEYYFSNENLEKDTFLQAVLSSTEHIGAVPIQTVAQFQSIRDIAAKRPVGTWDLPPAPPANLDLLRKALKPSDKVLLSPDGMWLSPPEKPSIEVSYIRPDQTKSSKASYYHEADAGTTLVQGKMRSPQKTTIVLREIPSACPEEEILFAFPNAESARSDFGDIWNVTFQSEQEAQEAINKISGKSICGCAVKVGLKIEPNPLEASTVNSADDISRTVSVPLLGIMGQTGATGMPGSYPVLSVPTVAGNKYSYPLHPAGLPPQFATYQNQHWHYYTQVMQQTFPPPPTYAMQPHVQMNPVQPHDQLFQPAGYHLPVAIPMYGSPQVASPRRRNNRRKKSGHHHSDQKSGGRGGHYTRSHIRRSSSSTKSADSQNAREISDRRETVSVDSDEQFPSLTKESKGSLFTEDSSNQGNQETKYSQVLLGASTQENVNKGGGGQHGLATTQEIEAELQDLMLQR